jgi:hypothetical protein
MRSLRLVVNVGLAGFAGIAGAVGVGGCTSSLRSGPLTSPHVLAPAASAGFPGPAVAEPLPVACGTSPVDVGRIADPQLNEISGVVESRRNPALLFVHNDSGDSPRFFAIDRRGQVLAELELPSVPLLVDAEDIAIGPGPAGASFIYLGDTGNNFASFGLGIPRRKAVLYRVPEPDVPLSTRDAKIPIENVLPIVFTFPRGARDVEAFFIDPPSGDLFMLSKQSDHRSQLLRASAAVLAGGGGELELVGELGFGRASVPGSTMPTAASVSRDGGLILVRTYESVLLFRRAAGELVGSALARAPEVLPAPRERQGEAISFVDADSAFLTISEGVKPALKCARLPHKTER